MYTRVFAQVHARLRARTCACVRRGRTHAFRPVEPTGICIFVFVDAQSAHAAMQSCACMRTHAHCRGAVCGACSGVGQAAANLGGPAAPLISAPRFGSAIAPPAVWVRAARKPCMNTRTRALRTRPVRSVTALIRGLARGAVPRFGDAPKRTCCTHAGRMHEACMRGVGWCCPPVVWACVARWGSSLEVLH